MGQARYTGVRSCPKSFVNRFRVVARKCIYFQKRVAKLGPGYFDCNEKQNSCTRRRDAKPEQGCPNCEYTIQYKIFIRELDNEIRRLKRTTWAGNHKWPNPKLIRLVSEIASISGSTKTRDGNWTVVIDTLVSVYRDESAKISYVDTFNAPASAKGSNKTKREEELEALGEFD